MITDVVWPDGWDTTSREGVVAGWRTIDGGEPPDLVLTTDVPVMAACTWAMARGERLGYFRPRASLELATTHVIRLPVDVQPGDVLLLMFAYEEDDERRRAADEVTRISLDAGMDD